MKIMRHLISKKKAAFISVLALVAIFLGKKIYTYSAAPTKEKDCDFVYPSAADQTKPTTIMIEIPEDGFSFKQKNGVINDASCLNKTQVYGVVDVLTEDDIRSAIKFARTNGLAITAAGERHSMGGQSFAKGGLVLDMRSFNRMSVDEEHKILTVESGAKWEDVQKFLDAKGLAVNAMQSINIFTVGGTLSVNAHGLGHHPGSIAPTVRAMRVMLASGEVVNASLTQNTELFRHVLGGYGLFGVILDVDIEVVDNELYEWNTNYISYADFSDYYRDHVHDNEELGLAYSRLSVAPHTYLKEVAVHTFKRVHSSEPIAPLRPWGNMAANRFVINFSKTGGLGRWTRWMLEKYVEPRTHTCLSRNEAMSGSDACIVSRNQKMFDSMGYLKNRLADTDILHEYFIPRERAAEFIDDLRGIVRRNGANLLNVTIRTVDKDTITALPYAKEDMFAFVLYFNQKFNERESDILRQTTVDLIDAAASLGGTFYLPYQLYYSPEQLRAAYPEADVFFAVKKKYDPEDVFQNMWYRKYGPQSFNSLGQ